MIALRSRPHTSTTARGAWLIATAAVGAAGVIGATSAISPSLAVGALVALIAVPAAVFRPKLVAHVMVASVFLQALSVGGVTLSRLVAPLALIAVVSQVTNAPTSLAGARTILGLVGAYVLVALASLMWTVDTGATVETLGALLISVVYMGGFAVLVRTRQDLRRLLWTVGVSALALAVLWLTQYVQGVDRRFNLAGDPNFTAAFLVMAVPLVVSLMAITRSPGRRFGILVAVAAIVAGSIATISRGGLLTLAVTALVMTMLPVRALHSNPLHKAAVLLAVAAGLTLILPVAAPQFAERFEQANRDTNVIGGRADLWQAALLAYGQHPVTGLGYGGFAATSFDWLRQTPGVDLVAHFRFVEGGEFVHNAYLESLTELGPAGAALFLGLLFATGRTLMRTARRARDSGDLVLISTTNALLVALISFGVSSSLLSSQNSRGLWMLVGLSIATIRLAEPGADAGAAHPAEARADGPGQRPTGATIRGHARA